MKRTFLFATLAGTCFAAVAQQAGPVNKDRVLRTHKADGHQFAVERPAAPASSSLRGSAFWSEDFSGGSIPAGWTNVDVGTLGTAPDVVFQWSNDPASVGPSALGYAPSSTFNGGTASNGYLWADSDRGLTSAPPNNHIAQLTTTAIDCSGQPSVLLTFDALIGVFDFDANENAIVRVSTDLTNWTTYQAFPCLVTGGAGPPCTRWSGNPDEVAIDISATAANQATVYIQWQWTGGWEYFWAIDDIALSPLPEFERSVSDAYMSHVGDGLEYHRIPSSEFLADFILGLVVTNEGANDQTNVTLTATITDEGGAEVLSGSETFGPLTTGQTDTMEVAVPIPGPLAPGTYSVTFSVSSDQDDQEGNTANDVIVRTFEVNDDVYSLDGIGVHPPALENTTSLGTNSFVGGEDALYCLTFFSINEQTTVYGLEALLAAGTEVDAQVIFTIHTSADVDNDIINNPIAESDFVSVTAADIAAGSIDGVFFGGPAVLDPGGYYAAISLYSNGNTADVRIVDDITVAQPNGASLIHLQGEGFFTNGNAHAIRLLLDPTVGINEVGDELTGVTMYPNPTNGTLWVNTEAEGRHFIEVYDVLGALVHTVNFNNLTTIDMSGLAKGVYTVRVANDNASTARRITVQ